MMTKERIVLYTLLPISMHVKYMNNEVMNMCDYMCLC